MATATKSRSRRPARKLATKPAKSNVSQLVQAIESGKSIIGMVGYVAIRDEGEDVYVKVKVKRISAEGCGLKIVVAICSGLGELEITPCRWLDTAGDVAAKRDLKARFETAKEELRKLKNRHYMAAKCQELGEYVAARIDEADFMLHAEEKHGVKSLGRLTSGQFDDLARTAVMVANHLTVEEWESEGGRYYEGY